MARPNPVLWVYYCFGGRLSERYRDWVLHDGTAKHWMMRAVIRGLVQIVPFAAAIMALIVVFGHSWLLAIGAAVIGVFGMLPYSLAYAPHSVNSRLAAYGFPAGHAERIRKERHEAENPGELERYRAAWRSEPAAPEAAEPEAPQESHQP